MRFIGDLGGVAVRLLFFVLAVAVLLWALFFNVAEQLYVSHLAAIAVVVLLHVPLLANVALGRLRGDKFSLERVIPRSLYYQSIVVCGFLVFLSLLGAGLRKLFAQVLTYVVVAYALIALSVVLVLMVGSCLTVGAFYKAVYRLGG